VRLLRLLILAAGAAYLYKRFVADAGAGDAETAAAEPFSSEQLQDVPPAPAEEPQADAAEQGQQDAAEQPQADAEAGPEAERDTLERPTWLDAADAGADAS